MVAAERSTAIIAIDTLNRVFGRWRK